MVIAVASCVAAWLGLQFASTADLVEVYATVTTAAGGAVEGLSREDFRVLEDDVPRPVTAFAAGDLPLSVAVALDRSFSMAGRPLDMARRAAHAFVDELRDGDEAMLLAVGSEVETVVPLTADRAAVREAVDRMTAWGRTALHDAILEAIDRIGQARGRRALVILSDGHDRSSRASAGDVVAAARRSEVLIYPVALGRDASPLLSALAHVSGGRTFRVGRAEHLPSVFRQIAGELRRQYLLGYEPLPDDRPGTWRAIRVEVIAPKGARVRARAGYVR